MDGTRRPMRRREFLRAAGLVGVGALAAPLLAACSRQANVLSFLNWTEYIAPETIPTFENETGIQVTYQTYVSNDELERILIQATRPRRGGRRGTSFDLMVPSESFVREFGQRGLLAEVDVSGLSNIGNVRPELREGSFAKQTVPWATGTTGIGYDATVITEPPSWDLFLDERFRGQMTLLEEIRDAFAAAQFSLGLDPNTTDQSEIDAARDRLIEMKRVIRGFDSSTYLDDLAKGTLVAAEVYSGDLLQAKQRNAKLDFVLPEAGALRWIDSMAVPVDAPQPDNALRFMDFYLRPEISAQVGNFIQYDTGNQAAFDLLDPAVRDNPIIFPPPEVLDRLSFTFDLGEEVNGRYSAAWKEVQAA